MTTTADDQDRHMPWPGHDHDQHGECRIQLVRPGVPGVTLHGRPCDDCVVEVDDGLLADPCELVMLRDALNQVLDLFIAGRREAECVGHNHPDGD